MNAPQRESQYLWLCLSASFVTFLRFSSTYFGPMIAGEYPKVSPTVHLHGWTFFSWYLLLPLQAALIAASRIRAILVERRRGEGVHPVYRWGLPLSVLAEGVFILATPTPTGEALSSALASLGAVLAPLC